jgi:hypothetical protein
LNLVVSENDLQTTHIAVRCSISPKRNVIGDIGGLIAGFCEQLFSAFYPRLVSKRANTVITELFNNAIENSADPASAIMLDVQINGSVLHIRMANTARPEQFEKVKKHIDLINSTDVRRLMAETIRERHKLQLKGGIGLMRLALENKSRISVDYKDPVLTVESEISLGGLQ